MFSKKKSICCDNFLGISKTAFNTSAAFVDFSLSNLDSIEVILSERVLRKKSANSWPEKAINLLLQNKKHNDFFIAENRCVEDPLIYERALNNSFPFFEYLKNQKMDLFSRQNNKDVMFFSHHYCHAAAAAYMSPFKKSIILVMDGSGLRIRHFKNCIKVGDHEYLPINLPEDSSESCSVYLYDGSAPKCIYKDWQLFVKSKQWPQHYFSSGLGTLYEKSAEYIFNSKTAAGKVMGLAAFGMAKKIKNREVFLESLNWNDAFSGSSKKEWENSFNINRWSDIAASVQEHFQESVFALLEKIKILHPEYDNLILAGGTALNCTTNMKIVDASLFKEIYVPPAPGDEGISLGLAMASKYYVTPQYQKEIVEHEFQHSFLGAKKSDPQIEEIMHCFSEMNVFIPSSIAEYCANELAAGKVIAWFVGRSEVGPRALGHRSILVRPDRFDVKNYLNDNIKFRENFRPYGCSVIHAMADEYFCVPKGFNNPFMSFAVKVRAPYKDLLKEITHVDGTSRMQTVREGQSKEFYELLMEFGKKTGIFCLLNTSLNVMHEPIVETIYDAKRFLINTPVDGLVINNVYITKKEK